MSSKTKAIAEATLAVLAVSQAQRHPAQMARAVLSGAAEALSLDSPQEAEALTHVIAADTALREAARCLDRAELAIAGAALALREPELLTDE